MIGQGLALKRLDLIRGLVLSNTAAKIWTAEIWAARIEAVRAGGMEAIADSAMARWFSPDFRFGPAFDAQRARFLAQRPEGWAGCAAAIAGTDVCNTTASLTLPTLCLAGSADGATPPPDLVKETADLIKGSRFGLIRGAGHLPPIDRPDAFAAALGGFLANIAHVLIEHFDFGSSGTAAMNTPASNHAFIRFSKYYNILTRFLPVHGSCHGAWCWRDVLPFPNNSDVSATAIDLPGSGTDATPPGGVTLADYARAITGAFSEPTVLAGHSAGG